MILDSEDLARIEEWLENTPVKEVECIFSDLSGIARGKSLPPKKFLSAIKGDSLRLADPVVALSITGEYEFNDHIPLIEKDLVLVPDVGTLTIAPWQEEPTATVICDCYTTEGVLFPIAPRSVLKNVLALYADKGWQVITAPEFEFYLIDKIAKDGNQLVVPAGSSGRSDSGSVAFSVDATDEFADVFDTIIDYCAKQDLYIDTLIHEDGPGQFEMNIHHGDALQVADRSFRFKRAAKRAALAHGYNATFLAKPYADCSGSSMHLHQSVLEASSGKNIFVNADGSDSELFLNYIGGLQKYLPAVTLFLAPFFNSYRRLAGRASSPVTTHWGRDNRTLGLRVPEASDENRRIENRIAGSDSNPYLAITASLVCGYLGIQEGLKPSEPMTEPAYDAETNLLPLHYMEALTLMRECEAIRSILGSPLIDTYVGLKETEYNEFLSVLSSWEVEHLTHNA